MMGPTTSSKFFQLLDGWMFGQDHLLPHAAVLLVEGELTARMLRQKAADETM